MIRCLVLCVALAGLAEAEIPKLDYSSYLGGTGDESAYAVATDASGNVYVTGFTTSSDLPVVSPLQPYYGGGTGDLFVAKLKADGSGFAYLSYIGGAGGEGDLSGYVGGIAVDAQGNAYVAGIARSQDFPTTAGAFQTSIGSKFACDADQNAGLCGDAFVLKLSPAGDRIVYSTFLGGSDYDDAKAIAIDSTGAAYVTGMTASPDFPTTAGAFQAGLRDVDAYVAKLSPDGSQLLYSTLIGGTGFDAGMAIAVDAEERAHVAGTTQAFDFPLKRPLQNALGDPWDAFVARLNTSGTDLEFSTYLGGQGTQQALGIALDSAGNIYVTGYTDSADFPIKNAFQPFFGGGETNGFVTKIARDGGAILYSTFLGGTEGATRLNAIAIDGAGAAYVVGQGGPDFPSVGVIQPYGGASDAIVAKLSADGLRLLYSTFLGGGGAEVASGIAFDAWGRVVVAGQTSSPDFPASGTAFQKSLRGASDAFVTRLVETGSDGPVFSSPKTIPAGITYVGQWSATHSITISNVGVAPLVFNSSLSPSNVRVTSTCSVILPGEGCTLATQLMATAVGEQSGRVMLYDNAPDSPQTISIYGTGVLGGDLELASLVAGASFSYYGKTAVPVIATVSNHGPYDSRGLQVSVTSDGGKASCDPCYVGNLKAGQAAVLRFNFVPSTYGMVRVMARVQADGSTPDLNPANNRLEFDIANPRYAASAALLSFGSQAVNSASVSQRITFTSLDGQQLQLSASTDGEYVALLSCDPGALRCYADVRFQPAAEGARAGELTLTEALAHTRQCIALTGTGVPAPHAKLSDTAVALVAGGLSTVSRSITLTNDGSAPLFLVSIGVLGGFGKAIQCPTSLMPGESCSITIIFTPRSPGAATGSLTISDNTPNRVEVVSLTGIGIPLVNLIRPTRGNTAPTSPASSGGDAKVQPARPTLQNSATATGKASGTKALVRSGVNYRTGLR